MHSARQTSENQRPKSVWGHTVDTLSNQRIILVVEDDDGLRRFWRSALRLEGFEVLEARDGMEALTIIDHRVPHLVVLDLGLPKLSGRMVRQELAAQAATRNIPILIVTGSTEDLDYLHVHCVLRKPVSVDQLVEAIVKCLHSGAPGVATH